MRAQLATTLLFIFFCIFSILPGVNTSLSASAQTLLFLPTDSSSSISIDSLYQSIENLSQERITIQDDLKQLSTQLESVQKILADQLTVIESRQDNLTSQMDLQFETLLSEIPDDEPLKTAIFYIQYLNQRQDSLIAYVERLETQLGELPDKHYWGVRNDFKEFDHLLLFTFLGAIMSLGLVLLLRGDTKNEQADPLDQLSSYVMQEENIDRLSMSITLLVGSILVLLFIIFIL